MNNREKGELIRHHILQNLVEHPNDIARYTAEYYSITPQAVYNHLKRLELEGWITSKGRGKGKRYFLGEKRYKTEIYSLKNNIKEDEIWREDFLCLFENIKPNVVEICHYGFTEMVNNVIDHSDGRKLSIVILVEEDRVQILIKDDGEGIFEKIKNYYKLADKRQALFELSKGKLTTDPENHTGEGIFFTSRVFDQFVILSGALEFNHDRNFEFDFLSDSKVEINEKGTSVAMAIDCKSPKLLQSIFDDFAGPEEYQFNKTVLSLKLALYDQEKLLSRSQAKRVLNRVDKFTNVVFDFEGIDSIGQAFADEVFRVFARNNPEIVLAPINMSEQIEKMIKRAKYHE